MAIDTDANKRVVTRYIREFWNGKNAAVLDELLDPALHEYTYEPRNRAGHESTLELMNEAFAGHETIIEEIIAEGDTVAVCQTLRVTQSGPFRDIPNTGKHAEIGGYRFFKIKDGKIVSHRALLDLASLLQQISAAE
jgi:predicted ester cyclase